METPISTIPTAEQSGIVRPVDAVSTASGARDAVELEARHAGSSVVVEAEGETEALFEQTEQSPTDATRPSSRVRGRPAEVGCGLPRTFGVRSASRDGGRIRGTPCSDNST